MEQAGPAAVGEAPTTTAGQAALATTVAAMPQGMDLELACELVSALVGDAACVGGGDGEGDGYRKRAGGCCGGRGMRRAVSASCTESARVSLQQLVHIRTHASTHAVSVPLMCQ